MQQEMVVIIDCSVIMPCLALYFFPYVLLVLYISGDVLVILDLRPDESLFEAGIAREVTMLLFQIDLIFVHFILDRYIYIL